MRTIKITILMVLFILATGMVTNLIIARSTEKECDVKKTEKAYWCNSCFEALEDSDVKSKYLCEGCGSTSDESGECDECEIERVKVTMCEKCDEMISDQKVEVCVKTGYICEDCGTESLKPGKCPDCKEEMTKITVKCRVIYKCKDCDYSQFEPGKCSSDEELDCYDKELIKTCENSGTFPHTKE